MVVQKVGMVNILTTECQTNSGTKSTFNIITLKVQSMFLTVECETVVGRGGTFNIFIANERQTVFYEELLRSIL